MRFLRNRLSTPSWSCAFEVTAMEFYPVNEKDRALLALVKQWGDAEKSTLLINDEEVPKVIEAAKWDEWALSHAISTFDSFADRLSVPARKRVVRFLVEVLARHRRFGHPHPRTSAALALCSLQPESRAGLPVLIELFAAGPAEVPGGDKASIATAISTLIGGDKEIRETISRLVQTQLDE